MDKESDRIYRYTENNGICRIMELAPVTHDLRRA